MKILSKSFGPQERHPPNLKTLRFGRNWDMREEKVLSLAEIYCWIDFGFWV